MTIEMLPVELQRLLRNYTYHLDTLGMSSTQTFRLEGPEPFYLKINPIAPRGGLKTEVEALLWLRSYLPAPKVVFYERAEETDYLLIRALPGLPASDNYWQSNPEQLAKILAESMLTLHNLDPTACPFDQRTATKLQEVADYVHHGLVDTDDFEPENSGQTPQRILDRLYAEQPAQDDLVVTHGDFCLPNLILNHWTLSGFIDVGSLGVGDRYQDLALCVRSLEYNLNTCQYTTTFFETYGLAAIDVEKLRYFRLLDELK